MRLTLSLLLTAAAVSAGASEVYRSVSPDGTVVYSDRPTGSDATPIALNVPSPDPSAAARPASSPGRSSDGGSETSADAGESDLTPAERAEQRRENCQAARQRAERYNGAGRLYRELPDGEREYLSDDEIDAARARAEADVETWCS